MKNLEKHRKKSKKFSFDYENAQVGLTLHDVNLLDFIIFNCLTNEILLEANYTIASYKLIDVKPSLSIEIRADLPNQHGNLTRQPFLIKRFIEKDSAIQRSP